MNRTFYIDGTAPKIENIGTVAGDDLFIAMLQPKYLSQTLIVTGKSIAIKIDQRNILVGSYAYSLDLKSEDNIVTSYFFTLTFEVRKRESNANHAFWEE